MGVPEAIVSHLGLLGFSGISNVLSAIKMAKYYEFGDQDIILTILTDSMEVYQSRLEEMHLEYGEYTENNAAADFSRYLLGESTDHLLELSYADRKRVHNLKYFTWVEQQGKTYREIQSQWYDADYWSDVQKQVPEIDAMIEEFNADAGIK